MLLIHTGDIKGKLLYLNCVCRKIFCNTVWQCAHWNEQILFVDFCRRSLSSIRVTHLTRYRCKESNAWIGSNTYFSWKKYTVIQVQLQMGIKQMKMNEWKFCFKLTDWFRHACIACLNLCGHYNTLWLWTCVQISDLWSVVWWGFLAIECTFHQDSSLWFIFIINCKLFIANSTFMEGSRQFTPLCRHPEQTIWVANAFNVIPNWLHTHKLPTVFLKTHVQNGGTAIGS